MQEAMFNKHPIPVSQWSIEEIDKLRPFAEKRAGKDTLLALLPGRSITAIKVRLYRIRRELGVARQLPKAFKRDDGLFTMLDRDDPGIRGNELDRRRQLAAVASSKYLDALQRLVA